MSTITLENSFRPQATVLSNYFIDNCMPRANGEFVKVYIYLARTLSGASASLSLEQMADQLICTEKDILRALKYWEKEHCLSLRYDPDKKLSAVTLLSPEENASPEKDSAPQASDAAHSAQGNADAALTPDRVTELKQNEDIVQLLYIAEQYLGKTLTPTETRKILFFYDGLNLPPDVIEYLIEYCVSRNHKSIRYMETVAAAWAEAGVTTVKMAKDASSRYSREYFGILKALGISNRNPVEDEIALMDTWLKDYGFSMELIREACSRTILQTGQPSFQYTDKILKGWKKKEVRSLSDVRALDAEHKKRRLEKPAGRAPASNSFNNFSQREYDFSEYEKRLLNQ